MQQSAAVVPTRKRDLEGRAAGHQHKRTKHAASNHNTEVYPAQTHVTQRATQSIPSNKAIPTIHPRNRYADQIPDFAALARGFPELQQYVRNHNGKASIDFRDAHACKCLTKALLHDDFNITWDIPNGQLVPPLANRANYIHWLEDLLKLSAPEGSQAVRGMSCFAHNCHLEYNTSCVRILSYFSNVSTASLSS